VLLVIFMVAAPMMQQGYEVDLPESRQSRPIESPVTITVPLTFRNDGRVQIDGEFVEFRFLSERARQAVASRTQKGVVLAGDGGITLTELMQVFDELQAGGVTQVAIQTQPAARR